MTEISQLRADHRSAAKEDADALAAIGIEKDELLHVFIVLEEKRREIRSAEMGGGNEPGKGRAVLHVDPMSFQQPSKDVQADIVLLVGDVIGKADVQVSAIMVVAQADAVHQVGEPEQMVLVPYDPMHVYPSVALQIDLLVARSYGWVAKV